SQLVESLSTGIELERQWRTRERGVRRDDLRPTSLQCLTRLHERLPWSESTDEIQPPRLWRHCGGLKRECRGDVNHPARLRAEEPGRLPPDDGAGPALQLDGASQHIHTAAEATPPVGIADDRDGISIVGVQRSADPGVYVQNVVIVARDRLHHD